jgi:hypothetical protein
MFSALINNFYNFLHGEDSIQVYEQGELIYSSRNPQLLPWLEYIRLFSPLVFRTLVFDKVTGNASALLAVKSGCRRVYSVTGSLTAARTLEHFHIHYEFIHTVAHIEQYVGWEICLMESLSIGKTPEEFYDLVRNGCLQELPRTPDAAVYQSIKPGW